MTRRGAQLGGAITGTIVYGLYTLVSLGVFIWGVSTLGSLSAFFDQGESAIYLFWCMLVAIPCFVLCCLLCRPNKNCKSQKGKTITVIVLGIFLLLIAGGMGAQFIVLIAIGLNIGFLIASLCIQEKPVPVHNVQELNQNNTNISNQTNAEIPSEKDTPTDEK